MLPPPIGSRESVNWTGLLDWNTGLDYWTEGAGHLSSFAHAYNAWSAHARSETLHFPCGVATEKWTVNQHRSESVSDLMTMEELEGACRSCPIVIADSPVVIADSPASRSPVKVVVNTREYR